MSISRSENTSIWDQLPWGKLLGGVGGALLALGFASDSRNTSVSLESRMNRRSLLRLGIAALGAAVGGGLGAVADLPRN